jgi:hypothetical protein
MIDSQILTLTEFRSIIEFFKTHYGPPGDLQRQVNESLSIRWDHPEATIVLVCTKDHVVVVTLKLPDSPLIILEAETLNDLKSKLKEYDWILNLK